ncbi:type III effector protein [Streptomyces rubiginosohelvolus]|uniref:type III effector protein n=1 Tax=Streptomyces rubiginosohelvolus TaxID=67362 RepID=UPI003F4B3703
MATPASRPASVVITAARSRRAKTPRASSEVSPTVRALRQVRAASCDTSSSVLKCMKVRTASASASPTETSVDATSPRCDWQNARDVGASWADLAHPLGVASRQAAERRYLRGRPGPEGTTGEQRETATRQARAATRTTAAWARHNAADLRRLAGQITALTDLPAAARRPVSELHSALAHDDPADIVAPLTATRPHLAAAHPDLAAQLDALTHP